MFPGVLNWAGVWTASWTFLETKYCSQIYINIDFLYHRVNGLIQIRSTKLYKDKSFEHEYFILEYY